MIKMPINLFLVKLNKKLKKMLTIYLSVDKMKSYFECTV